MRAAFVTLLLSGVLFYPALSQKVLYIKGYHNSDFFRRTELILGNRDLTSLKKNHLLLESTQKAIHSHRVENHQQLVPRA